MRDRRIGSGAHCMSDREAQEVEAEWLASNERRALMEKQARLKEALENKPSGYTPERIVNARDFDSRTRLAPPAYPAKDIPAEDRRPTRTSAMSGTSAKKEQS